MTCDKGYEGDCCCECHYHLEVEGLLPGGYVCIVTWVLTEGYTAIYDSQKHGCCELHRYGMR